MGLIENLYVSCDWDGEKEEDYYFDISKYVKISDFPCKLSTNYRWNDEVNLSVHNFKYFKKSCNIHKLSYI